MIGGRSFFVCLFVVLHQFSILASVLLSAHDNRFSVFRYVEFLFDYAFLKIYKEKEGAGKLFNHTKNRWGMPR